MYRIAKLGSMIHFVSANPARPRPLAPTLAPQDGCTPLYGASEGGFAEVVDRLIVAKARVEFNTKVLHSSARTLAIVHAGRFCYTLGFLHSLSIPLFVLSSVRASPLKLDCESINYWFSSESKDRSTRHHHLACSANPALLHRACTPAQDGWTPLITASCNGHPEVVDRLIAARAVVDAASKVTPAHTSFGGRMFWWRITVSDSYPPSAPSSHRRMG
jgi:hypothetical protein